MMTKASDPWQCRNSFCACWSSNPGSNDRTLINLANKKPLLLGLCLAQSLPPWVLCLWAHCARYWWPRTETGQHCLAKSSCLVFHRRWSLVYVNIWHRDLHTCVHSHEPIPMPQHQTSSLDFSLVPSRLLANKPCCSLLPINLHMS